MSAWEAPTKAMTISMVVAIRTVRIWWFTMICMSESGIRFKRPCSAARKTSGAGRAWAGERRVWRLELTGPVFLFHGLLFRGEGTWVITASAAVLHGFLWFLQLDHGLRLKSE